MSGYLDKLNLNGTEYDLLDPAVKTELSDHTLVIQ